MAILGTDIWAGNTIDYAAAYNAGIRFAYIRTWSGSQLDSRSDQHRAGCRAAGIKVGSYYVGNPYPGASAASYQAEQMLDLSQDDDLIPAMDFEQFPGTTLPGREDLINFLVNFYTRLEQLYTGKDLFYCNMAMIQLLRPVPEIIKRRLLWFAYPGTWIASMIAPWTLPTLHQYALDVTAPWATGGIDKDGCNVPLEEIRRIVVPPVVPLPTPLEDRVAQLEAEVTQLKNDNETQTTLINNQGTQLTLTGLRLQKLEDWAQTIKLSPFVK